MAEANYPTSVWNGLSETREDLLDIDSPSGEDYLQCVAEVRAAQTELDTVKQDVAANAEGLVFTAVNSQGGPIVIGQPVYMHTDGTCKLADADGSGILRNVVGLVTDTTVANGGTATIKPFGFMTATTTEWDAVAGTSGGLSPGTVYYLSDTAGALTASAPSTTTDTQYRVIIALTATRALILPNVEQLAP